MSRSQATASASDDSGGQQAVFSVDLDGEQLNHIPSSVHPLLASVTRLNLANNRFVEAPILNGLTSLQSLTLAHNCISKVCVLLLCYLPSLLTDPNGLLTFVIHQKQSCPACSCCRGTSLAFKASSNAFFVFYTMKT